MLKYPQVIIAIILRDTIYVETFWKNDPFLFLGFFFSDPYSLFENFIFI